MKNIVVFDKQNEQGFTLVELLVVIAIIAVLTAIAVPTFLNQRKSAADTALRSDLKSAALMIQTSELTPKGFLDVFGKYSVNVVGEGAVHSMGTPTDWNSKIPQVPAINPSEGTLLGIFMYGSASSDWTVHSPGEFCIYGVNSKSHYNFIPGAGMSASLYTKNLYYDVKFGGIATMDELVASANAGNEVSCSGHVKLYKDATGL